MPTTSHPHNQKCLTGELAKTCLASHDQKLTRAMAKTCLDLKCTVLEPSHDQQNAPNKGTDQDLLRSNMPAPEQGSNCEKKKVVGVGKRVAHQSRI